MKFLPFFYSFVLFCCFCWLISVSFIFVIVLLLLLLLFCFLTDCLTGRSQAKLGNTRFLSQSPFWKYSYAPDVIIPFNSAPYCTFKQVFLISNPVLARPRQGEIKVQQLGVSFMDLKFKNMRMCNSREYHDLVPFDNLSSVVIDKDKTDQLLSFIPAESNECICFQSQEYLFPIALPHPVPDIACKLLMTIVTRDLIQLLVNRIFLHRSIIVILLSK